MKKKFAPKIPSCQHCGTPIRSASQQPKEYECPECEGKTHNPRGLDEDAPANCVGGGAIAGMGVGPDGAPPGKVASMSQKPLKRKTFKQFIGIAR